MLQQTFGEDVMSRANAFKWHKELKNNGKYALDVLHKGSFKLRLLR